MSFVDCPGHDILMATMLNGAAVMDAALLLVAANEPCPQPQTSEHLAAIEIMQLKHILVLQVSFFSSILFILDNASSKSTPLLYNIWHSIFLWLNLTRTKSILLLKLQQKNIIHQFKLSLMVQLLPLHPSFLFLLNFVIILKLL